MLTGETVKQSVQGLLPIIRTDAGGFFGLGEHEGPQLDNFEGRFAHLISNALIYPRANASVRSVFWNRTGGLFCHRVDFVNATGWAFQQSPVQIRSKLSQGRYVSWLLFVLDRPLLFGGINLAEIGGAGHHLRCLARFDEVGGSDGHHPGNDNHRQYDPNYDPNVACNQSSDGQTLPRYGATRTFDAG